MAPALRRYIVDLVEATRRHADIYLGASPRASMMLLRAARAFAAAEERDYVIPDDVKALAVPVLAHRIIVTADAVMSGTLHRGRAARAPRRGRRPGRGEPLMPSGRGLVVFGAGLAMWVAARDRRLRRHGGRRASGSSRFRSSPHCSCAGAARASRIRRRLSDVRVTPGTRVTVRARRRERGAGAHVRSCWSRTACPPRSGAPGPARRVGPAGQDEPRRSATPCCPRPVGATGSARSPSTSPTRSR